MYFLVVVLAIILICAFMRGNPSNFLGLLIALSGVVLLLGLVADWWQL
jgi:hypothetical protein